MSDNSKSGKKTTKVTIKSLPTPPEDTRPRSVVVVGPPETDEDRARMRADRLKSTSGKPTAFQFDPARTKRVMTAKEDMARQLDEDGGVGATGSYNLSAMWKAVGSPPEKAPHDWAKLAGPLIAGVADYLENMERFPVGAGVSEVTHVDGWLDLWATYIVAFVYAMYLDGIPEPGV